jgi:hypothetical protein
MLSNLLIQRLVLSQLKEFYEMGHMQCSSFCRNIIWERCGGSLWTKFVWRVLSCERYNAVWSTESQRTLRRNMSPASSGSRNEPSNKPAKNRLCFLLLHAGLSLGLFLNLNDGGNKFLRNVGWLSTTTRRYISEVRALHNHRCENLKSYIDSFALGKNQWRALVNMVMKLRIEEKVGYHFD